MRRALTRLVSLLPPDLLRSVGSLQFKLPIVGPLIGLVGRKLIAGEGVIKYGAGRGLKFDATGGFPGYVLGTSEPSEQEALTKYLKPGGVFYDIGANVGFYSTIAARIVGPDGLVYAFDPSSTSITAIRRNAAMNGFSNVEAVEAAVSERSGRARFVQGTLGANSSVVICEDGDVKLISVDEFVAGGARPPDVVMIDVEGAEVGVLSGMLETIRRHRPVIMCEVHWIVDEFDDFRENVLGPLGYTSQTLTGDPFPVVPKHYHAILLP